MVVIINLSELGRHMPDVAGGGARISIAIVDDHPALLAGLRAIFAFDRNYEVVATGKTVHDMETIHQDRRPEIFLVDLSMPGDILTSISDIVVEGTTTKFVVYTASTDVDVALASFDAGVRGFVVKDSTSEELIDALRSVMDGDIFVSQRYSGRILAAQRKRGTAPNLRTVLSRREAEVARFVVQAKTNKEIAIQMSISEKTVKHYMTNLMTKLNARNRVEVAMHMRID
ncbi:MAG: response regulator transcription factor [bacterium]